MNPIILIEECPYLDTGTIKQDLRRCRQKQDNISGIINIGYGKSQLVCNYWFEYVEDDTFLVISNGNDLQQQILISQQELLYGARNYFICDCGKQACKLYLPPGMGEFKCRSCYKLRYELSTINRKSSHGKFFYITNRTIKLANQRVNMNRIIYKQKYSKRFERYLKLCGKAGLHNVVQEARDLMTAIKNQ